MKTDKSRNHWKDTKLNKNTTLVCGSNIIFPDLTGERKYEDGIRFYRRAKRTGTSAKPLVSIITVCKNSVNTINQTIQSVLNQTYENIEYIIIDGNSNDGTQEIISNYLNRIEYYISEPDNGLYHAMNKGLTLAMGEYVLYLNSDDWYAPDSVESLVFAKLYSCADFVGAQAQYVNQEGQNLYILESMPYNEGLRLGMPLRHELMLVSADIYNHIGGYEESYRIISDFHFTLKLWDAGYTYYEVPRALLYFRKTGISNTANQILVAERFRLIKEQFPFMGDNYIESLSNPQKIDAEKINIVLNAYPSHTGLVNTLIAYAERRNIQFPADFSTPADTKQVKVSIILPVYNSESTLRRCLESLICQTLKEIEIICINDKSTDNSQMIIDEYLKKDLRIRSYPNSQNINLGPSRNKGIRLSTGRFIFHVDPDDAIPENSLEVLYKAAIEYDSDMVKGSYLKFSDYENKKKTNKSKRIFENLPVVNTNIRESPELLSTTEGHWSYLYKSSFARKVNYPQDLKMGQDSLFLVCAMALAKKISVIEDVVYYYIKSEGSAMSNFNFRKYKDAIEWRRRAWFVLRDAGLKDIGNYLILEYWGENFFKKMPEILAKTEIKQIFLQIQSAFYESKIQLIKKKEYQFVENLLFLIFEDKVKKAIDFLYDKYLVEFGEKRIRPDIESEFEASITVMTMCSRDDGGAGIGSRRRVAALRDIGIQADIYTLLRTANLDYIKRIPLLPRMRPSWGWRLMWKTCVTRVRKMKGYCAVELFSLPKSFLNFNRLKKIFKNYDIIHLHWVVGMLDYKRLGKLLGNKPVVWTLADMNAFTGGCHYSNGCQNFLNECDVCPQLGGNKKIAHKSWQTKKKAYQNLRNLHIVCPSQWMADQVKKSSLFSGRPVHVISNGFPVNKFVPYDRNLARIKLGLPLDKKLVLFGGDSLANIRKGADLAKIALKYFMENFNDEQIEIITYGNNDLNADFPVRNIGFLRFEHQLSLAYSAADLYLFPSREDNAPMTVAESLLCGTPVVSFPVGNVPELVKHKTNGYIATYLDTYDLAKGIRWILDWQAKTDAKKVVKVCRDAALNLHEPTIAAIKHRNLYKEMLRVSE
jgi:glycosyltransferase involved in cell wall biosynthesis